MFGTALTSALGFLLTAGLQVGTMVPDFTAQNQDGKSVTLSALRGHPVLLYFYPKDDTPGCTQQACELRNRFDRFQKAGVLILGVSRQDAASHRAFRAKHRLPFDLLTDADGSIAKGLGVETMPLFGLHRRQSLIVAADGTLAAFFPDVNPSTHADEVLAALQRIDGGPMPTPPTPPAAPTSYAPRPQ